MKHLAVVVMSCFIRLKMRFLITNNLPRELILSVAYWKVHKKIPYLLCLLLVNTF